MKMATMNLLLGFCGNVACLKKKSNAESLAEKAQTGQDLTFSGKLLAG
jgi:hypothetical protein